MPSNKKRSKCNISNSSNPQTMHRSLKQMPSRRRYHSRNQGYPLKINFPCICSRHNLAISSHCSSQLNLHSSNLQSLLFNLWIIASNCHMHSPIP